MHVIQSDAWPHPKAVLLAKLAYSLFPDIFLALRKRPSSHASNYKLNVMHLPLDFIPRPATLRALTA